jgi:hypothetical protein
VLNGKVRTLFAQNENARELNKAELLRGGGPVWYRGYALTPVPEACADLQRVLAHFGARRMVSGHTPQRDGVLQTCGGRYVCIDLGISPAYYSNAGGLEMWEPLHKGDPWEVYAVMDGKPREKLPVPGRESRL